MDLSICILTHIQPALLPESVEACLSEVSNSHVAAEIIIIDNASSDAYPAKLAGQSPLIRIIRNKENLSFSAAYNIAIRSSTGRYVLILNDDAILQPGSLGVLLRVLETDSAVGAVGPKLVNPDGTLQLHFTNRRFPHLLNCLALALFLEGRLLRYAGTRRWFGLDRDLERSGDAEHLAGACLLVRREALEAIGLFDENFHYWFEDTDLCYRLKKGGWRIIYLAEAHVIHYKSASIGRLPEPRRVTMFFTSQMCYAKKHWSVAMYLLLRLASALALLIDFPLVMLRLRLRDLNHDERVAWTRAYLPVAQFLLWRRN